MNNILHADIPGNCFALKIKCLDCRARAPISCPCEEMFKLWTRDDLED